MTPQDVRKKYTTTYNFRKQTGMATATLSNWERVGHIPAASQMRLESVTKGELKASLDDLPFGKDDK